MLLLVLLHVTPVHYSHEEHRSCRRLTVWRQSCNFLQLFCLPAAASLRLSHAPWPSILFCGLLMLTITVSPLTLLSPYYILLTVIVIIIDIFIMFKVALCITIYTHTVLLGIPNKIHLLCKFSWSERSRKIEKPINGARTTCAVLCWDTRYTQRWQVNASSLRWSSPSDERTLERIGSTLVATVIDKSVITQRNTAQGK